jgi:hypothetical protein
VSITEQYVFADDEAPDADPPQSSGTMDLSCEVCGVPLIYGGRGRKPRFCEDHKPARSASIPRGSSDVAQALAVMDGMYTMLSMLLTVASPNALVMFRQQVPMLQERNAVFFAADKNLCKSVCKVGSKGGKTAFVSSNVLAVAPVLAVAVGDMRARSQVKAQAKSATQPVPEPSAPPVFDPDAAFRR